MKDVIIEVLGGVAEVTQLPHDVDVTIIDWDNLSDMEYAERLEWAAEQNEVVQKYMRDQGYIAEWERKADDEESDGEED